MSPKRPSPLDRLFNMPILLTLVALLGVATLGVFGYTMVNRWKEGVINANMTLTELAAHQMESQATMAFAQIPFDTSVVDTPRLVISKEELTSRLTALTESALQRSRGVKGGFWVPQFDEFIGYAYPTSPPPRPVYGPPPRSYNIIHRQVVESIESGEAIIRLHQFDPAVFPLATIPIYRDSKLVAVVWARVHIERELPALRLRQYLNILGVIAFFAFLIFLLITISQRREIRALDDGLRRIEADGNARLDKRRGMFGSIRKAINRMVSSLQRENEQRQKLEMQLHQQDKMAALGNLLAGVAHEVKTPLAIMKTRIQIWQRNIEQHEQSPEKELPITSDSMEMVITEINRLSDLIKRLLHFARPSQVEDFKTCDPNELILRTIGFVRPRLNQMGIQLETRLMEETTSITCDPDSIHQVLLNIITNSIEALGADGLIEVTSELIESGSAVRIRVLDNGPGLEESKRGNVFDPFYTTKHHGAGLGLSIAYEIVQVHEGTISFDPPPEGWGTLCSIVLPLTQTRAATT